MWNTTQQWDFPNAWSPLQYFIIEGLNNLENLDHIDSENYTKGLVGMFQRSKQIGRE